MGLGRISNEMGLFLPSKFLITGTSVYPGFFRPHPVDYLEIIERKSIFQAEQSRCEWRPHGVLVGRSGGISEGFECGFGFEVQLFSRGRPHHQTGRSAVGVKAAAGNRDQAVLGEGRFLAVDFFQRFHIYAIVLWNSNGIRVNLPEMSLRVPHHEFWTDPHHNKGINSSETCSS